MSVRRPVAHGILLVDKRPHCTSHDVVARVRKLFGQRAVGHAGTLDPLATGLLVILLGEATKLSGYLTANAKSYVATVRFGEATDTLDADGRIVARVEGVPPPRADIERAIDGMRGASMQVPPAVSAIKHDGVPMHERTRRGESVDLAPREVELHRAEVRAVRGAECEIELTCSKGFYVRAFARDLAARLGTVAHLLALRRTASGTFHIDEAISGERIDAALAGDEVARDAVRAALRPIADASRALERIDVPSDVSRALAAGQRPAAPPGAPGAVLVFERGAEQPLCIAERRDGAWLVLRGFSFA